MFGAGTGAAEFVVALFASAAVFSAGTGAAEFALASGAADVFGAAVATDAASACWGWGLQSDSSWNVPGRRNMFWIMVVVSVVPSGAVWLTMALNTPCRY